MIEREFLESLIRLLDESSIDNVEIERGGTRVRISKSPDVALSAGAPMAPHMMPAVAPAPAPAAPSAPAAPADEGGAAAAPASSGNLVDITSPMVGTFYRAPAPDADAYVEVGKSIGEGDVLCIIEAMKLMNELESESSGKIAEICVQNGDPVEFGQVLFRVEPA